MLALLIFEAFEIYSELPRIFPPRTVYLYLVFAPTLYICTDAIQFLVLMIELLLHKVVFSQLTLSFIC